MKSFSVGHRNYEAYLETVLCANGREWRRVAKNTKHGPGVEEVVEEGLAPLARNVEEKRFQLRPVDEEDY